MLCFCVWQVPECVTCCGPASQTERERWRLEKDRLTVSESVHGRMDDVDVSTPWGPFHHTRGPAMTSSLLFSSFSLSLSRSFSVTLSLPPGPFPLYVPASQRSALVTGSSHLFVWCREGVALFLDSDEMRIGCRMWKRSGTNGGMVQGQSSETKPLWAGCMCCICGGIWLQLQVPLGLFWAWA